MEPLKMVCPGFGIDAKLKEDVQNGIALTREKWEFGESVAISVSEGDAIRMRDWLIARYPIAQKADEIITSEQQPVLVARGGVPMQPIEFDTRGTIRFRENRIVRHLLDFSTPLGCGLNEIARMDFSQEDRMQLTQLIGYSVSGYSDLSYVSNESVEAAERIAATLSAQVK